MDPQSTVRQSPRRWEDGMDYTVEKMREEDWEEVRSIYLEGIATGHATFETEAPGREAWDGGHLAQCRLVARGEGRVLGWAALSPVSRRPVFSGVAEVSVYVAAAARGRDLGKALLGALVEASESAGIWTLQASIFHENPASLAIHATSGFREVGCRERIACLDGRWRNTVLMERRSVAMGT